MARQLTKSEYDQRSKFSPTSIFKQWRVRCLLRKKLRNRRIERTEDGFTLYTLDESNWSLRWEEVTAVVAYKLDRSVVDQICFGFRILNDQVNLRCIDEDTPGFKSILGDLASKTQNAWPDQFSTVAQPPFEACWTELWVAKNTDHVNMESNLYFINPPTT